MNVIGTAARVALIFCTAITVLIAPGCSLWKQESASVEKGAPLKAESNKSVDSNDDSQKMPAAPQQEPEDDGTNVQQPPHLYGSFQGSEGEFAGGTTVTGYNLAGIRRVSHPKFIRLVLEFTRDNTGETGEAPPQYKIKLLEKPNRIAIDFKGVTKAEVLDKKDEVLGLSSQIKDVTFTKNEGDRDSRLELVLAAPVTYQVFELGNPARIVIVLNPVGDEVNKI